MPVSRQRHTRQSKYSLLADKLRAQVSEGRLKPGDQLPSFMELRTEHGVSRGTVDKVHALLERDGLIIREQGRGVFVAGPKRRTASGVIAFSGGGLAETRSSLYWAFLMQGIQTAAAAHNVQLLLVNETAGLRVWESVDGLLLSHNEEEVYPILEKLPTGFPCISILTPIDELSCVLVDDVQGARDATLHLLSLGHTKIGHLVSGHSHQIENRLLGYRQALREYDIEPPLAWVRQLKPRARTKDSKAEFFEQGKRTIAEWLATDWLETGCSAILVQNDPAAIGAMVALQTAGIRVPEEVSVVGFDGVERYDYVSPRLTTVEVPVQRVGSTAVELLLAKIRDRSENQTILLPSDLRIGQSTAAQTK